MSRRRESEAKRDSARALCDFFGSLAFSTSMSQSGTFPKPATNASSRLLRSSVAAYALPACSQVKHQLHLTRHSTSTPPNTAALSVLRHPRQKHTNMAFEPNGTLFSHFVCFGSTVTVGQVSCGRG